MNDFSTLIDGAYRRHPRGDQPGNLAALTRGMPDATARYQRIRGWWAAPELTVTRPPTPDEIPWLAVAFGVAQSTVREAVASSWYGVTAVPSYAQKIVAVWHRVTPDLEAALLAVIAAK